jgi:hypothetical protein
MAMKCEEILELPEEIDDTEPDASFDEEKHPFKRSGNWLNGFIDERDLSLGAPHAQRHLANH